MLSVGKGLSVHCAELTICFRIFAHKFQENMTIKAAFFDIDGTLVSFRTHQIPQSTIHAIAEAKQRGVKIFISTGRPVALINNIKEVEQLVEGYIAFNGAYCFIGNDEIATTPLPAADVMRMVDDATRRDYCVIVCGKNQVAIHNYKPIFNEIFVEGLGVTNIDMDKPVGPLLEQPVLQLTPFITEDDERLILPEMTESISARWHPAFTDITVRAANKGSALAQVARHLGIKTEECIAFGDGGNDKSILKAAGIGVAMGNAAEEVKAVADHVTTSVDDDGIANAMRKFGLIG